MQLFQDIPEVQVHIKRCKESLSKLQESEEDKEGAVGSVAASKVADAIVKVESWEREIENVWKKVKMLSQRIQVAALWNSGTTVSEK